MSKELNKASLSERLDLFANFLNSEIPKISFFDLAAGFIFNRILFEVEQHFEEDDTIVNSFLLFVIINNVILWLYHNYLSPFEMIANFYQKKFFIEYLVNPALSQEAAIEKIGKLKETEEKNWLYSAIPMGFLYTILIPFNRKSAATYFLQSSFPMVWSLIHSINKACAPLSSCEKNVRNSYFGLNKAIKGGDISFTHKNSMVMEFSVKKKHHSLSLANGPKLQLSSELSLRIITNVIRLLDPSVLIILNSTKKEICLEITSMPKFLSETSNTIIDTIAESLKLHLLAAQDHLALITSHLKFLNRGFQLLSIPNRWHLYYSEDEQQFMKEQPELILDSRNFPKSMLPVLIRVLEQYGYRPTTEDTLLKLLNWDQVIATENDIALLTGNLKLNLEIKYTESNLNIKEEVKSIFPNRTFFLPSESKINNMHTRSREKIQTIISCSTDIKTSLQHSEIKLIFYFGLFGNSDSPHIKKVQTKYTNEYIFIFVTQYIKMKMGNFAQLMKVYEDPTLNLGEGPGFKYSQEKIDSREIFAKLKGKNVDESPASTLGFHVQQSGKLPTPTFYIFNTWFRHNRTCHSARINRFNKLPLVDLNFLDGLYKETLAFSR